MSGRLEMVVGANRGPIVNVLRFILHNRGQVLELTLEHLWLVGLSTLFAMLIGGPALGPIGVLLASQTSRALAARMSRQFRASPYLAFCFPCHGWATDQKDWPSSPSRFTLLLPIIRNTYTGITGVGCCSPGGRTRHWVSPESQLLFQVELPLAVSVILSQFALPSWSR